LRGEHFALCWLLNRVFRCVLTIRFSL
jgi:hypothetical protein